MDCKEYKFNKSFESMLWQERNYKVYVSCLFPKMFNWMPYSWKWTMVTLVTELLSPLSWVSPFKLITVKLNYKEMIDLLCSCNNVKLEIMKIWWRKMMFHTKTRRLVIFEGNTVFYVFVVFKKKSIFNETIYVTCVCVWSSSQCPIFNVYFLRHFVCQSKRLALP